MSNFEFYEACLAALEALNERVGELQTASRAAMLVVCGVVLYELFWRRKR